MNLRKKLLQSLYAYFSFDGETAEGQPGVYHNSGNGEPRFLLNRVRRQEQERYTLSSSLLLSVIDYKPGYTISAFMDERSQFFSYESPDLHNENHLHKHHYFELSYVIDGQLDLIIENTRHRFLPGDACIINPSTSHKELRTAEYTVLYLGITLDYFHNLSLGAKGDELAHELYDFLGRNQTWSDQIDYLSFTPLEAFRGSPHQERLHGLMEALLQELPAQEIGYAELCRVYILRIFAMLQNPAYYICSNTRFQMAYGDALFERTLSYVSANKRKLSRKELEQALSYNGDYISRVFQKHTGQTLAEYNRDVCMGEAARLLLNSDMRIVDICHQIGYENKTVFYNIFQKKYGMTPKQYREKTPENENSVI